MENVVIKTRVQAFNIDALNRTAVCASDIDNGCVFHLDAKSTTSGESGVWSATAPTAATDKGLWMATSPEVVITKDAMGHKYRGLTQDPRAFINYAGEMIDATKISEGDIIEMTGAGITGIGDTANVYLVPSASFTLVTATAAGTGLCLKKIETSTLKIGTGDIAGMGATPTYKFECVNN